MSPLSLLMVTQKALKERGIDTMLEEARADNRENDAEYMKPSIKSRCESLVEVLGGSANIEQSYKPLALHHCGVLDMHV